MTTNCNTTTICEDPVKIFIKDIHELKLDNDHPEYYPFGGKLIRKVDIMGVVTEVRSLNNNLHLYRVDDCTGEILCRYNHQNRADLKDLEEIDQLQDLVAEKNFEHASEAGVALELLLEETYKRHKEFMNPLKQGDCAHIQGFIFNFFDRREVTAFKVHKVSRIADEVDRVFEVSSLYSQVYSKIEK